MVFIPEQPCVFRLCDVLQEIEWKQKKYFLEQYEKDTKITPTWESFSERNGTKKESSGAKRLRALVQALEQLDKNFPRSESQRIFHKNYIAACLKKIYGADINKDITRLLKEYDLEELRSDIIVTTPRRHGKTVSVALFVAAYLVTQPDCEVSIYSTGRRASKKLLASIYNKVILLSGKQSIRVYNQEALEIKGTGIGNSKCFSYPSKVQIDEKYQFIVLFFFTNPNPNLFRIPCTYTHTQYYKFFNFLLGIPHFFYSLRRI